MYWKNVEGARVTRYVINLVEELKKNPVCERAPSPSIVHRGCSASLFAQLWSKQSFTVNEALGHRLDRPTRRSSSISPLIVYGLFLKPIMSLLLNGAVREALTRRDGVLRDFSATLTSIKMPSGTVRMIGSDATYYVRPVQLAVREGPSNETFACQG